MWSCGSRLAALLLLLATLCPVQARQRTYRTEAGQTDPREEVAESRVREQDILGEIDRIDRQLQGLAEEIRSLQEQVDRVEARRLQAEDELAAAQAHLDLHAEEVSSRAVMLYRLSRRGLARILFGAESPADLRRRTRYLLALLEHDRQRLSSFGEMVERRQQALARVDQDRSIITALQAKLRLKEATLRDERARRMAVLEEIRSKRELALRALKQKQEATRRFSQSLKNPPASIGSSGTAGFRKSHGRLPWPTTGRLIRSFGIYEDPNTGKRNRNYGIDIEAAYGTPFRAVFDGVVTKAGFIRGYGQTVVLNHGAYSTVYAHANGLRVNLGQLVSQGDVLGFVGNSGLVDGAGYRLHFEIRYNTSPQDPLDWLSPHGRR